MKIITIIEDDPITGVKYGIAEIPEQEEIKIFGNYVQITKINSDRVSKLILNRTKQK